jgi:hypothetical protein
MNKLCIAVILLLIALVSSSGCEIACKWIGVTCGDNIHIIRVSEDPQACKSIKVDCTNYGDQGYFNRPDGIRYMPFSDETGCGCRAVDWNNG